MVKGQGRKGGRVEEAMGTWKKLEKEDLKKILRSRIWGDKARPPRFSPWFSGPVFLQIFAGEFDQWTHFWSAQHCYLALDALAALAIYHILSSYAESGLQHCWAKGGIRFAGQDGVKCFCSFDPINFLNYFICFPSFPRWTLRPWTLKAALCKVESKKLEKKVKLAACPATVHDHP